jgi:hypothetical protein
MGISIMTLGKTTISINDLFATLSINDTQFIVFALLSYGKSIQGPTMQV